MKLLVAAYSHLDLWIAPEWFAERLRTEFPQFNVVRLTSADHLAQELMAATVLFGGSLNPDEFREARCLRWIHSPAAAVHQLLFPELVNREVVLTNAREVHGAVVAEHVIAMMFALARRIPESVRFQREHVWGQELLYRAHQTPQEIADATIGLVGLGNIGRNVAQRAAAIGARVIAVREHAERPKPQHVDEVFPSSQLEKMRYVLGEKQGLDNM